MRTVEVNLWFINISLRCILFHLNSPQHESRERTELFTEFGVFIWIFGPSPEWKTQRMRNGGSEKWQMIRAKFGHYFLPHTHLTMERICSLILFMTSFTRPPTFFQPNSTLFKFSEHSSTTLIHPIPKAKRTIQNSLKVIIQMMMVVVMMVKRNITIIVVCCRFSVPNWGPLCGPVLLYQSPCLSCLFA